MPNDKLKKYIVYFIFDQETVGLGCGHEYCKDCWRQYLTIKISDDGHAESICCPAPKCGIVVDDVTVMQLVTDENIRQKYQHLMTNSFIEVRATTFHLSIIHKIIFWIFFWNNSTITCCVGAHRQVVIWPLKPIIWWLIVKIVHAFVGTVFVSFAVTIHMIQFPVNWWKAGRRMTTTKPLNISQSTQKPAQNVAVILRKMVVAITW